MKSNDFFDTFYLKVSVIFLAVGIMFFLFFLNYERNENVKSVESMTEINMSTRGSNSFGNKYESGENFLVLKIDGTFEANLKDAPNFGNWEYNDGTRELRLLSLSSNEGKGRCSMHTYNVLEINDDEIIIISNTGEKIQLKSN